LVKVNVFAGAGSPVKRREVRIMTHNPKKVAAKLQTVVDAWKTLRPTKSLPA